MSKIEIFYPVIIFYSFVFRYNLPFGVIIVFIYSVTAVNTRKSTDIDINIFYTFDELNIITIIMKLWRYSGMLLLITGVIHTIYAILIGADALLAIIKNGLINAVGESFEYNFAFWFLICGVVLILFGQTLHYYIKKEQKPTPLFLGYGILVFTILGCAIVPVSGFWLFLPQALIIIFADRVKV